MERLVVDQSNTQTTMCEFDMSGLEVQPPHGFGRDG